MGEGIAWGCSSLGSFRRKPQKGVVTILWQAENLLVVSLAGWEVALASCARNNMMFLCIILIYKYIYIYVYAHILIIHKSVA